MATLNIQFGAYIYKVQGAHVAPGGWAEQLTTRGEVQPVPRTDVALEVPGLLGPRVVTAQGVLVPPGATTRAAVRDAIAAFRYAHRPGYRDLYLDDDRAIRAQVTAVSVTESTVNSAQFSVRWECPDPYWRALAAEGASWQNPVTGVLPVNNSGGAEARPAFTFTIDAAGTLSLTLQNTAVSSPNAFSLSGAVGSGDIFVVDCAAQTVTLNGANALDRFGGWFWRLAPGVNNLALSVSGATLAAMAASWVPRWL